jgi:hypothetical protein
LTTAAHREGVNEYVTRTRSKSDLERRARAYRELKKRVVSESPQEFSFVPELRFALTPRLLGARALWTF